MITLLKMVSKKLEQGNGKDNKAQLGQWVIVLMQKRFSYAHSS